MLGAAPFRVLVRASARDSRPQFGAAESAVAMRRNQFASWSK